MGCACRGNGRAGGTSSSGAVITGYQYTYNGETRTFLTLLEAKATQRRNGGGTITQLTE